MMDMISIEWIKNTIPGSCLDSGWGMGLDWKMSEHVFPIWLEGLFLEKRLVQSSLANLLDGPIDPTHQNKFKKYLL